MNLVEQAYKQHAAEKSGKHWELPKGYQLIKVLRARPPGLLGKLATFGFIARYQNNLEVVFRGTDSAHDWLANGNIDLIPHRIGGEVHQGGYDLHAQMADAIEAVILANPGGGLTIRGHSLGCWLATFAAADLAFYNPEVILYAAPRPGDIAFANAFNKICKNVTRHVNTEDIVPTLPTPHHYCHVGQAKCFTVHTGDVVDNHSMILYAEHSK